MIYNAVMRDLYIESHIKSMNNIFQISDAKTDIFNSSPPGQNGRHFGRRQFQVHFPDENGRILIWISLKCVPRSLMNNKLALVEVMAWRRLGDKPLSEPMLIRFTDAYMMR